MAKRSGLKGGDVPSLNYPPPNLTESEVVQIEKETIERVSMTISALESAMASWEMSKDKPQELSGKIARYRVIHEALSAWQTKALKTYGKSDMGARVKLLWEFVDLCRTQLGAA